MYRLQISLSTWQVEFLKDRARRDGVSIAEVVRQLVQREVEHTRRQATADSIWDIAGIGEDHKPLIENRVVSENTALYLGELSGPVAKTPSKRRAKKHKRVV